MPRAEGAKDAEGRLDIGARDHQFIELLVSYKNFG
jgi:hypothetical protein